MDVLIPCVALSLHLLLSVTATDSIRISLLQTYEVFDHQVLSRWGTLMVEDIETLSFYRGSDPITFKQSWSKASFTDTDWATFSMMVEHYVYYFEFHIQDMSMKIGYKGNFTAQCWAGCPSSEKDTDGYIFRVAGNGEELIYFNFTQEKWMTTHSPYSSAIQKILQRDRATFSSITTLAKRICPKLAIAYAVAGREAFSRKIQPKAYITSRPAEHGTEVHCWVTGFYPQPINVSLWTEDKMEDGLALETLPNGDGTYQITVMASLTGEQDVFCRVEHSSFKEPFIVQLERKRNTHVTLAVSITIVAVALVVGMVIYVQRDERCRFFGRHAWEYV
ncbi:antigen-presenting glycoprotein CD1d-like [Hyperolius riggenbachi]|uniref:antigen-presenting glycoprotein CD1d-like n=1 Tax=Hyperolius riggenbachi TaxID=752182 RepID=UPI0035A343CB